MPKLPAKKSLESSLLPHGSGLVFCHSWSFVVIRGHLCVLLDMIRGFAKIQDYNTFLIY